MIGLSVVSRHLSVRLSKRNREFERIALMDPRLHIPNRRLFEQRLASTFVQTQREQASAYLMLLDVDHFKQINDNYGHEIGDYILLEISNILRQTLLASDTPARFGGDELAVIAINYKQDDVCELAQQILEKSQLCGSPIMSYVVSALASGLLRLKMRIQPLTGYVKQIKHYIKSKIQEEMGFSCIKNLKMSNRLLKNLS
jgi:diguanylate cyclase (GGDEF)-like protein